MVNINKLASGIGKIITKTLGLDGSDITRDGHPIIDTELDDRELDALEGCKITIFGAKIRH